MMKKKWLASMILAALTLSLGLCGGAAAQSPSMVSVRLMNSLSSDGSRAGDKFTATLAEPLVMGGRIVARKDALVTGQVTDVISSGRLSRPALITLRLNSIQSRTARYPLDTGDLTVKADSHGARNIFIIGGSAGAGAIIGGAAASGKGAAIGALAGAGAGTLGALLTGKHEITLPSETVLTFYVTTLKISPSELARMQPVESPLQMSPLHDEPSVRPREEDEGAYRQDAYREVARGPYDDRDERYDRGPAPPEFITFAPNERNIIVRWFARDERHLPPGLSKRDRLPPGLEKQLRERGTLPPGLQKRAQPLPFELERELRPVPRGYHRMMVSGSVILVNDQTSVVCDIVRF